MKKLALALLLIVALVFTSCSTFRADYYVEGEFYTTQESGAFAEPSSPMLNEDQVFDGWVLAGTDEPYTAWDEQPKGEVRFDAAITNLEYINYYVDGRLYATQLETEFADPGVPALPAEKSFIGWASEGSDEIVNDWTAPAEGVYTYNAVLEDNVCFYLNGELWKAIPAAEFANPGKPADKLIPRGYEFAGWVAEPDYQVYSDWSNLPEGVLRFDALLIKTTVESNIGAHNVQLNFNPYRQVEVLGPVFIDETYEIVDGSVKIGGIGYNDMMKAAVEKYPEADQVIDIVVDYTTERYTIQYDANGNVVEEGSDAYPVSVKDIYIRTASYTGLAIDIK